jgi:cellulose synthase/poly-beta-1,6-N-acetylglucosamine synthase-like glycosyltransferase
LLILAKIMLECSIGIMAYNEEKNIAHLLLAIQNQKLSTLKISEITVVTSGCTDRTEEIVKEFSQKDERIRLIRQTKREGKSSAINLWLKSVASEILILESADTIPDESSLEKLTAPFENKTIGMTGAHPIPVNDPTTLMGFATHLLWKLHHLVALKEPKMGEVVAFRNIVKSITQNSAVDEASLEAEIIQKGYRIVYVSEATIKNKGPETISDFLRQRRRIAAGHLWLKANFNHQVSTMDGIEIFKLLAKNFNFDTREIIFTPLVILLEIWGRFLGWYDYRILKKNPAIWEIAQSTKNLSIK